MARAVVEISNRCAALERDFLEQIVSFIMVIHSQICAVAIFIEQSDSVINSFYCPELLNSLVTQCSSVSQRVLLLRNSCSMSHCFWGDLSQGCCNTTAASGRERLVRLGVTPFVPRATFLFVCSSQVFPRVPANYFDS